MGGRRLLCRYLETGLNGWCMTSMLIRQIGLISQGGRVSCSLTGPAGLTDLAGWSRGRSLT